MSFEQVIILLSGALAIALTQAASPQAQRWAPLIGIVGQPFWLQAAWQAEQWGMLVMSAVYTGVWAWGIWTKWIRPGKFI